MWTHRGSSAPAMPGTQLMYMRKNSHVLSLQSSFDLTILIQQSPD